MKDLTTGREAGLIARFTIPMLIGNVFQQMYNIADSLIVGQILGKEALGAIGASFPILFMFIAMVIGFTSGISILIAQYYGAKDYDRLKKSIDTGYIMLFIIAVLITVFGLLFTESLLKLLQTPADILPQAKVFLSISFLGMVFIFGYNAVSSILRGLGDSKTPLYFLIFSTLLNIGLVFLFVLGFHWGIAGSAWATLIAQGAAFILALIYVSRTNEYMRIRLNNMGFDWAIFIQSLKLGLPSGIQQMLVAFGMMAMFRIINGFGTDATAAMTAVIRIENIAIMPAINFSMALSAFAGQNLGAGKVGRVIKGFKATVVMASIVALTATTVVILGGKLLVSFFNVDPGVIKNGTEYLLYTGGGYLFFTVLVVANGLLIGAGETIVPMISSLFSLWLIRIPLAVILSHHIGLIGVWAAIPIGWFIGCCISCFFLFLGKWKKKSLTGLTPEAEEVREETMQVQL